MSALIIFLQMGEIEINTRVDWDSCIVAPSLLLAQCDFWREGGILRPHRSLITEKKRFQS